jgi:hypothetical protein
MYKKLMLAIGFVIMSELGILIFHWMKGLGDWEVRAIYYVFGLITIGVQYMVNKWAIETFNNFKVVELK